MQDNRNRHQGQQKMRDASVRVLDSWTVLEDLDFARLQKLSMPAKPGEDLWVYFSLIARMCKYPLAYGVDRMPTIYCIQLWFWYY